MQTLIWMGLWTPVGQKNRRGYEVLPWGTSFFTDFLQDKLVFATTSVCIYKMLSTDLILHLIPKISNLIWSVIWDLSTAKLRFIGPIFLAAAQSVAIKSMK